MQNEYRRIWQSALVLNNCDNLFDSTVQELSVYFRKTENEIKEIMDNAKQLFAQSWKDSRIDTKDEEAILKFYNSTELEIFELAKWHTLTEGDGPLYYVKVLQFIKDKGCCNYLDYGSGIGSGAILFARHAFDVAIADISKPLLEFASYRCKRRDIEVTIINLTEIEPPSNRYDFITCFDVLEHSPRPMKLILKLNCFLKNGGFLFINCPFYEMEDHPMHISTSWRIQKYFRYYGFKFCHSIASDYGLQIVLKKVTMSKARKYIYLLIDLLIPLRVYKLLKINPPYMNIF
jgi:2-polyprenyl-3-methyl-5-hydroxy-6-metoxy-1,4-benzoquinol methylase